MTKRRMREFNEKALLLILTYISVMWMGLLIGESASNRKIKKQLRDLIYTKDPCVTLK